MMSPPTSPHARKKRVAVLISGSGTNLQALIDAAAMPDYPAELIVVISNKADAYGLERAKAAGIKIRVLDHAHYQNRADYDAALNEALHEEAAELVCLAGFMRILSADFTKAWYGRMLNIHPSLLPSFKGLHTHEQALEAGVKLSGCTVHFVSPEMDSGPIIAQAAVPVLDGDTAEMLRERVLEQEHIIYPQALKLLAQGKLTISGNRVIQQN